MKQLVVLLLSVICVQLSISQNISPNKLFVEGLRTTMTRYNEVGIVKGTTIATHQAASKSGQNIAINTTSNYIDANGGTQVSKEVGYKLNTNAVTNVYSFFIDMKYFLPVNVAYQYRNYNLTTSGSAYDIPSQVTIGQSLNNLTMNYTFVPSVAGFSSASTTIQFMNRVIDKREKITVPAGTYMCYVISEIVEIKTNILTKQRVKRWINPEIGFVKIEVSDMNGNLIESEQLTQFQLPNTVNSSK
ncbi:hypothetical protein EBU94_01420 [bacterium]|nr:hypothetical protein [bacterium]